MLGAVRASACLKGTPISRECRSPRFHLGPKSSFVRTVHGDVSVGRQQRAGVQPAHQRRDQPPVRRLHHLRKAQRMAVDPLLHVAMTALTREATSGHQRSSKSHRRHSGTNRGPRVPAAHRAGVTRRNQASSGKIRGPRVPAAHRAAVCTARRRAPRPRDGPSAGARARGSSASRSPLLYRTA